MSGLQVSGLQVSGLHVSGLHVSGLSVAVGGRTLVDDVSWSAPAGQITALVGPNGAGKSTMLRAIAGVVPERATVAGSVLLGDERLDTMPARRRARRVALVEQLTDPVPREHLTQAMFDGLPSLLGNLVGDERNVLLTLARILYTLQTGLIAPRDVAAEHACPLLAPEHAATLHLAARAHRGEARDDWTERRDQARAAATALTDRIDAIRP